MSNNISFKSNINFVSSKKFFRKFKKGQYIDFIDFSKELIEAPEFFSMNVKTCTAGGALTPNNKAMGFHFNDSFKLVMPKAEKKSQKYERGLLIGSKKTSGYINSCKNFKLMKKYLTKRLQALSIFERHRHQYALSNFHYSLDTDTWTINTRYVKSGYSYNVLGLKSLIKAFKYIKIAKGDRLFFEGKEVLPQDFPAIFECVPKRPIDKLINKLGFALIRIIP